MRTESLEHFLYGPVPGKGYAIRAESPAAHAQDYKELCRGFFVPIDPSFLKDFTHEARMIISAPNMGSIYFSRIFKGTKLDDKGRSGILSHTVIVPLDFMKNGLSYHILEDALQEFEKSNGILEGKMPALNIEWDESGPDLDTAEMQRRISKESLKKVIEVLQKGNHRIFLIHKASTFRERIELAYAISKTVDIKLQVKPLTIVTEPPLPLILDSVADIIISPRMISLKANKGWAVIKPFKEGVQEHAPVDKKKIDNVLDDIFG